MPESTEKDSGLAAVDIEKEGEAEPIEESAMIEAVEALEEGEKEVTEKGEGEGEEEKATTYTDAETAAMKVGWKPKNQMKEGEDFFSAEEFLRRGDLLHAIQKQNRKQKDYEKVIADMTEVLKKQGEKLNSVEVDKIKEGRKTAIENGDVEAVDQYDKLIKKESENVKAAENEVVRTFAENNSYWFNVNTKKTSAMRDFAIEKEVELRTKNPNVPMAVILQEVKDVVVEKHENFFKMFEGDENMAATKPQAKPYVQNFNSVSSGQTVKTNTKPKKQGFADLPKELQNVVRTMVCHERVAGDTKLGDELDAYAAMVIKSGAVD